MARYVMVMPPPKATQEIGVAFGVLMIKLTLDELIRRRSRGIDPEAKIAQYAAARVDAEGARLRPDKQVGVRTGGWYIASSCPSATASAVRPRCASLS